MKKWIATVIYADGELEETAFPYTASGNYNAECEEQFLIENRILYNARKDVAFYSVDYVES